MTSDAPLERGVERMLSLSSSAWGALIACPLALSLSLWGEAKGWGRARAIGKLGASLAFLVLFALSPEGPTCPEGFRVLVGAGLLLSAIGDGALLGSGARSFLTGLSAFLLAHIAFLLAFTRGDLKLSAALLSAPLCLGVGGLIYRRLRSGVEERLRGPVIAYIIVIAAMVACAAARAMIWPEGGALLLIGAVAFWCSDISVALDRFAGAGLLNRLWGLPLYYGAQLCLTLTLWC